MTAASHNPTRVASAEGTPFGAIAAAITGAKLSRQTRTRLGRGDSPRSGEPVWRNSYYVGQIEDRIWKPIHDGTRRGGKRWTAALLRAAERFEIKSRAERREREPGARNGALGEIALRVLKYLYEVVDYASGRLEPALRTIADEIGHAYSAVHKALVRLRAHGFLSWMRRSRPIDDPEPGGPQVEQVSNAYGLLVPTEMRDWLGKLLRPAPQPGCEADRRRRDRNELEAMLEGMTAVERHDATFNAGALLGETLRSLAALIDRRELKKGESSSANETGGSF